MRNENSPRTAAVLALALTATMGLMAGTGFLLVGCPESTPQINGLSLTAFRDSLARIGVGMDAEARRTLAHAIHFLATKETDPDAYAGVSFETYKRLEIDPQVRITLLDQKTAEEVVMLARNQFAQKRLEIELGMDSTGPKLAAIDEAIARHREKTAVLDGIAFEDLVVRDVQISHITYPQLDVKVANGIKRPLRLVFFRLHLEHPENPDLSFSSDEKFAFNPVLYPNSSRRIQLKLTGKDFKDIAKNKLTNAFDYRIELVNAMDRDNTKLVAPFDPEMLREKTRLEEQRDRLRQELETMSDNRRFTFLVNGGGKPKPKPKPKATPAD